MDEPSDLPAKNKWHARLAIISLILFAIFWSLGSFFFWTLLGLSGCFVFLAFYSSDIKFSIFERRQFPENSYRAYRSTSEQASTAQFAAIRKLIRTVFIVSGSILIFLFLAGVFAGNDGDSENSSQSVEVSPSEPAESDDIDTFTNLGNDFFSQSQYDSALKYYEKVLAIDQDNQYCLYNKGLVYYMKQDYKRSISIVRKCLRDHPDYDQAWWLIGDDYTSIGNYDSALFCLNKAYGNDYRDPGFLQLMADTYLKKDNRSKAKEFYLMVTEQDSTKVEVYQKLAELDPGNADLYRRKAKALDQTR